MTVIFNSKGVLVNNSEGETVICGHLDMGNNLYIDPTDTTIQYEAPKQQNIVKILQHRTSISYSIKCVLELIRYLHAAAGFHVKETWIVTIAKGWYIA